MARLIVEAGKNIGEEHALSGETKIGRDPSCPIRIDDTDISREHALIRPAPEGGFEVVDLGSKNGTWLNDERVDDALLEDGDRLRVGNTVLLFLAGERADSGAGPAADSRDDDSRDSADSTEGAGAGAKAASFDFADAIEVGLFAVLVVLVFLVASYAARIVVTVLG